MRRKLELDIGTLRALTIKDPVQATQNASYTNNYGEATIPQEGLSVQPPDFMSDKWLNAEEPYFSYLSNGYIYEEARYRKDFYGPERISLPDGTVLELKPSPTEP